MTVRFRTGTFAFTARRAEPLHHGHHVWSEWLDLPQRPPVPETGAHLTELYTESGHQPLVGNHLQSARLAGERGGDGIVPRCSRLESNQHLLRFRQAPSPDRLREHNRGRGGARPRASSTIRLSKIAPGRRRVCSGMRTRTSIDRVKACWPAISRSPIVDCVGHGGVEPPSPG